MQILKNVFRGWLRFAVVITLLSGLVYIAVQQVLRTEGNDPQIQIAEDTASALTEGQAVESVVSSTRIDIAQSLAPYVVVFDDAGKVIASSGLMHNQPPTLPPGVLDYVRQHGQDRVTWQPEPGVRSATVITHHGGSRPGFVMAGRSLREVENRVSNLELIIGLGWLGTCLAALVMVALIEIGLASSQFLRHGRRRIGESIK
jgi:hypothetical protein